MSVARLSAAWSCVVLVLALTPSPVVAQLPPVLAPTLAAFSPHPDNPIFATSALRPASSPAGAAGSVRSATPSRRTTASSRRGVAGRPLGTAVASAGALLTAGTAPAGEFLRQQLRQPRVRAAFRARADEVAALYAEAGISPAAEIYFRVFKREQVLEVWALDRGAAGFVMLGTYPVCRVSGRLGPKRREGDRQIPEGFYTIDLFNPWSNYHLSMRVSYPNEVDRARRTAAPLGGNIFIHGGCSTIGCVPLTDAGIEEVYLIAAQARAGGQERIPVHIFPTRLDEDGIRWLGRTYGEDFIDFEFWQNLREGYEAFERSRVLPSISPDGTRYAVRSADAPAVAAALRGRTGQPGASGSDNNLER